MKPFRTKKGERVLTYLCAMQYKIYWKVKCNGAIIV